jgi:hypothetical protein
MGEVAVEGGDNKLISEVEVELRMVGGDPGVEEEREEVEEARGSSTES